MKVNAAKNIPFHHKDSDVELCCDKQHAPNTTQHHRPECHHHRFLCPSINACGLSLILLLLMTQLNVLMLVCVMDSPVLVVERRVPVSWKDHYLWPFFSSSKTTDTEPKVEFVQENHQRLQELVQVDSILSWTKTRDEFFQEINITAVLTNDVLPITRLHGRPKEEKLEIWRKKEGNFYLWEGNICFAARNFLQAGAIKPHVLFTYLNENRGALGMDVKNRTIQWDHLATHWTKWGCTDEEIWAYLDHPLTKAVFTTQHQSYSHPKVHSIPLGVAPSIKDMIASAVQLPPKERTQLLMINDNGWRFRAAVSQYVMNTFARHRPDLSPLRNTYSQAPGSAQKYIEELRISKFILAPSGLGWDCYRIWEALYMGVIPIVETYERPVDAWRETLEDLPVLWVEHYEDVTPELLETEYVNIAARAKDYNYEKLTKQWWIDYIKSYFADDLAVLQHTRVNEPEEFSQSEHSIETSKSASHLFGYYTDNSTAIPRILHFVYVTPGLPEEQEALPSDVQHNIHEWQRLHPDWMVVLWDNAAVHREFPDLVELVKPIPIMSWIADLLRYHVLEKYGGVYLDADIVPIRSLDPLRNRFPDFTACEKPESNGPRVSESEYTVQYCELVNIGVIGVPPHHPALKEIMEVTVANTRAKLFHFPNDGGPFELTTSGPPIWSKSAKKFDMTLLHPSLFYPCNWNAKDKCRLELWKDQPHVYGMHEWKMSWFYTK